METLAPWEMCYRMYRYMSVRHYRFRAGCTSTPEYVLSYTTAFLAYVSPTFSGILHHLVDVMCLFNSFELTPYN